MTTKRVVAMALTLTLLVVCLVNHITFGIETGRVNGSLFAAAALTLLLAWQIQKTGERR